RSIINISFTERIPDVGEVGNLFKINRKSDNMEIKGGDHMAKEIFTTNAPEAIGPYSQAIEAGGFVYVSGQIPINPDTGEVEQGIENQTKQVLKNLQAILTEAGTDFSQV